MKSKLYEPTVAFAAIFQSAALLCDYAKYGTADNESFKTSIHSLYQIDAKNISAIFGGISTLQIGFRKLIQVLDANNPNPDLETSTYVISLIHLQKKLSRFPDIYAALGSGMQSIVSMLQTFPETDPHMITALADLYQKTLEALQFRIKVIGNPTHLQDTEIINKIRALLLAGLRAAILWTQVGGSRWQLLFSREKMVKIAREIVQ